MRALLVVDVQVDFCEGGALGVSGGTQVARDVSAYLREHHHDYGLVVASADWHTANSTNEGHIALPPAEPNLTTSWPVHCIADTPGAAYHDDLDLTYLTHHVHKGMGSNGYSAFEGVVVGGDDSHTVPRERLAMLLRDHGVTDLDVAGIATDHCVRASGLDARRDGFGVSVLSNLVAGVDAEASARALLELQAVGAVLRP